MKQPIKEPVKPVHTVTHTMADGTVLTDITQYEYDPDKLPFVVLQIVGNMLLGTYSKNKHLEEPGA